MSYPGFDEDWLAKRGIRPSRNATEPRQAAKVTTGKAKTPRGPSPGEVEFANQCHICGIAEPVAEYTFHPTRKWRFDFAWPIQMIAVEIDGGTWTQGRHTRGAGVENDCEKFAEAILLGWRVFRFTTEQVTSGYASLTIQRALEAK